MADQKPKHKPSEKHTLDEVLKSLKDLIRNDLVKAADAPPAAAPPPPPPVAAPTDDINHTLDSLEELITEIAHPNASPSPPARLPALPPKAPILNIPGKAPVVPAEPPAGALENAAAEPPPRKPIKIPPRAVIPAPVLGAGEWLDPQVAAALPLQALFDYDDIPVLEEIVAHGAAELLERDSGDDQLPSPNRAREIAVKIVAKLNIERRQKGEPPLDVRTIERLQMLLRDALDKGPPR